MAVKVFIKRTVPPGLENELNGYLKLMRSIITNNREGYMYGETLKRVDQPGEYLVISTWQNLDAWNAWFKTQERKEVQDKIDTLLGKSTEYQIYTY